MNHYLDKAPDSRMINEEHDLLYFGGTSYLGLQTNPEFQELLFKNIKKLGTNWGASRKSNIRLSIFEEFEKYLSQKAGTPDGMCVSSGYMAGQMLARYFSEKGYDLLCAPNTHPALIQENSRLFQDYEELGEFLRKSATSSDQHKLVLFLDTVDFSGINYPDFDSLKELPLEDVILVADDSHGFGLIGEDGYGIYDLLKGIHAKELIVCGSLGKALATPCGVVLGNKDRIEGFRNMDFFAGGSPPSPAALKTLMEAEEISNSQLIKLRGNIITFLGSVTSKFQMIKMDQHPVFGYNSEALTEHLLQAGIITTNFRYPTKTSPLVSKIVLNADHSRQDILELTEAINSFFEKA
ncbi:aminotransferase class I/II-fold pyridoxal phosphate-dependent enzyme [Gramella jeungdoensis]|uniref:Aminotransferase class I/II-fold pyridoxal phosphate-dependent enzyme n=1 Tax=Gramella jeungdoensis TaxID=708091 RepID=A0ABT0YX95_9FLAO|nr:aminotransferase class I/II-fold pyridoxal phosphate-dependent enzyme [Gramella jeungdoensis]MCM8568085.1 aminotransferase class I/II-fold pyridoxal phosphate-dependent enzyme [Gramella jeungdoensis]